MTKIPSNFRLGNKLEGDAGEIQNQLAESYEDLAKAVNRKPQMVVTNRDPEVADRGFNIGTFWFNYSAVAPADRLWILNSNNPVTWTVVI